MKVISLTDSDTWNNFLLAADRPPILQTYQWGELKGAFCWRPFRLAVMDNDEIVGGISLLKRPIPKSGGRYLFYAPEGPVFKTWSVEIIKILLDAVRELALREKVVFLRVDPLIRKEDTEKINLLNNRGFVASGENIQPPSTIVINLDKTEDGLLKSFKAKHRYNIRLAARRGVSIDRPSGSAAVARFYRLLEITKDRQKFLSQPLAYYQKVEEILGAQGMTGIFIAHAGGEDLAAVFIFRFGDTIWYMYGASGNQKRNFMPAYLLHWEVMRWAKSENCRKYDLWGIPVKPEPAQPLWGVYRFKNGFNGEIVNWAGCFDLPFNPALYKVMIRGWQTFKAVRNLVVHGNWRSVYGEGL